MQEVCKVSSQLSYKSKYFKCFFFSRLQAKCDFPSFEYSIFEQFLRNSHNVLLLCISMQSKDKLFRTPTQMKLSDHKMNELIQGAFTYDVSFLCRQVGQAASDFTKQVHVHSKVSDQGWQVQNTQKTSDVICECFLCIILERDCASTTKI